LFVYESDLSSKRGRRNPILDLALALNYRKRLSGNIHSNRVLITFGLKKTDKKELDLIDQAMKMAEEVADYLTLVSALLSSGLFLGLHFGI